MKISRAQRPRWIALGVLGFLTLGNMFVSVNPAIPESGTLFEPVQFESLPENDLQKPALSIFQSVAQRPLFAEGRKPVPGPSGSGRPGKPGLANGKFRLLGIATAPNGQSALIQVGEQKEILTVKAGNEYGGWTVMEIGPDFVRLNIGQRSLDLRLPKSALGEGPKSSGEIREK